jgi:hypothetical protein
MSFSAHADAKGIMQLISWCEPKNVMLVQSIIFLFFILFLNFLLFFIFFFFNLFYLEEYTVHQTVNTDRIQKQAIIAFINLYKFINF